MVSLKDIATECGVSVATVSKALNGHSDIGDETKARVVAQAAAMGYVPNAAAKALRTERTYNIGVLFVDEASSGLTHDYFSQVLDAFKRRMEDAGYDLTFISNNRNLPGRRTYLQNARYRQFDGILIACIDFDNPEVEELVKSEIPVVIIDHVINNTMSVVSDNIGGMTELATYVFDRGHNRVAYIHGDATAVTTARLAAFHRVAAASGVDIPDEYIKGGRYRDTQLSYEQTLELLDLPKPPTCILYPDDFAVLGGLMAIEDRGLTVPGDISIAGYDGLRMGRHMRPRLTTLRQDTEAIGSVAAESLIDLVERPKVTLIQSHVISGKLFEGESVAPLS